jgi:ABC-type transport system substrate-binding protein
MELSLRSTASGGPTALDIARRLLSLADPASPDYAPGWAAALRGVEVADLGRLSLTFGPHVRPEAWMSVDLVAGPGSPSPALAPGPYVAAAGHQRSRHYASRPELARLALQPAEIVERRYDDTAAALGALRRGEVSLVARVAPRLLPRARSLPDVVVSAYALPTVHVLLANPERPFTARRTFRRALAYALDRPGILKQDVLEGQEIVGCRPLDGPFPPGVSFDDPLAYGFDPAVPQRAHDPRLALALSRVALYEVRAADKLADREETQEIPELTLAHPADEVARTACRAIRAQWQAIGLRVRLHELSSAEKTTANGPYDVTYAELAIWEPVVDAQRLFGPGGLAPASPYLELALRRLESATTWEEVRARLREIHRLVYDDATLIPLWQMVNHLAYHRSLSGIAERPLQLYDSVENWRIAPRLPEP